MRPGHATRLLISLISLIGLLGCLSLAQAQEATERFIPIGESPGLSGKYTVIGEIQAIDSATGTMTVAADGRTYDVKVTERTRIWIDRSHLKLAPLTGNFADCEQGLKVEVKFAAEAGKETADWIKVQYR